VCPDKTSTDKVELLKTLGATVEVVPSVPIDNPNHFSKVAQRRAEEIGAFFTNQFDNPHNEQAHYETTGPEIWSQTGGEIDVFVTAMGTGGTCSGVSRYLKEKTDKVKCYVIDPPGVGIKYSVEDSGIAVAAKTPEEKVGSASSILEGIGSGRVYHALNNIKIDGVFAGDDQIAIEMVHYLLKHEGLFVGGSSGLNVTGALWAAKQLGPGHTIVTILCDTGHNYKRDSIYSADWLATKNIQLTRTTVAEFLEAYTPETKLVIHT